MSLVYDTYQNVVIITTKFIIADVSQIIKSFIKGEILILLFDYFILNNRWHSMINIEEDVNNKIIREDYNCHNNNSINIII